MEKKFFLMILVISTFVYSLGSFPIYQLKKKNWFVLIALRFTFTYIKTLIKCSLVAAFFVTGSRVDI